MSGRVVSQTGRWSIFPGFLQSPAPGLGPDLGQLVSPHLQTKKYSASDCCRVESFGLLCVLQAVLNVSLRLAFTAPEAAIANVTEERDQLQTRYSHLIQERGGILQNRCVWCGQSQVTECPAGWRKFGCSCYLLSSDTGTWPDSRQDCLSRGADLVTVNSLEEQVFLITQFNRRAWIGLTDVGMEGGWRWTDGSPLSPRNDWKCREINRWICEKDM